MVSRNVASLVSVPRTDPHQVQVLTALEAQKLIEVARGHWLEPLLILAVTTGLRRGELLGLRRGDIDFDHMQLYVHRTVNRYPGHGYVENDPKTKRSRRNIALSDVAIKALKQQRHTQEQLKAVDALTDVETAKSKRMLIHFEIQPHKDTDVPERLLEYNILIRREYKLPVSSCVILGDGKIKTHICIHCGVVIDRETITRRSTFVTEGSDGAYAKLLLRIRSKKLLREAPH